MYKKFINHILVNSSIKDIYFWLKLHQYNFHFGKNKCHNFDIQKCPLHLQSLSYWNLSNTFCSPLRLRNHHHHPDQNLPHPYKHHHLNPPLNPPLLQRFTPLYHPKMPIPTIAQAFWKFVWIFFLCFEFFGL